LSKKIIALGYSVFFVYPALGKMPFTGSALFFSNPTFPTNPTNPPFPTFPLFLCLVIGKTAQINALQTEKQEKAFSRYIFAKRNSSDRVFSVPSPYQVRIKIIY